MHIRPFETSDTEAVVRLSLRAWAPVFVSIREAFGHEIDDVLHPDWRVYQQTDVERVLAAQEMHTYVAETDAGVVGFAAIHLLGDGVIGEVHMLAVDPDAQRQGIGVALTEFAMEWIKAQGYPVVMIGTGGDPGHAPARRTYEKAGLRAVHQVSYWKKL